MIMSWRNRSRHHSERINQNVNEKSNPETNKIVKVSKVIVINVDEIEVKSRQSIDDRIKFL